MIVRAGERVDDLDAEAFAVYGLLDQPNLQTQEIVRGVAFALLLLVITSMYLKRVQPDILADLRLLLILEALFLLTLFSIRLLAPIGQVAFVPAAFIGIVFASLTTPATAVVASFAVGISGAMIMDGRLEYGVYVALGSSVGALLTSSTDRVTRTFFAGLMIGLTNVAVIVIFRADLALTGRAGELGMMAGVALLMGITTAIAALAILYVLTLAFNLPTSLKLAELSQPNHPLLQRLLREAPGTYQHSLQVANLSEQAANAVGANSELVRVSALYHDVGKVMNPIFFVENQADQVNPHDALNDPYRSASIIISHVPDGDRLARQHRLPPRVRDFIWQHHGTTRVSYFYNKAVEQTGDPEGVDSAAFTYPGPRPQTREAAIMMLADSSESTVRARKPSSRQEIAEIVQQIIDARTVEGQLDESNITLKDLRSIHNVFVEVLQGVFHPRINYPALATRRTTTGEVPAVKPPAPTPAPTPIPVPPIVAAAEEDTPMVEVPRLRVNRVPENGASRESSDEPVPAPTTVRGEDE
ncbi:MAG: HDIG domain-containing protein [Anaerolineae bacterium]